MMGLNYDVLKQNVKIKTHKQFIIPSTLDVFIYFSQLYLF